MVIDSFRLRAMSDRYRSDFTFFVNVALNSITNGLHGNLAADLQVCFKRLFTFIMDD